MNSLETPSNAPASSSSSSSSALRPRTRRLISILDQEADPTPAPRRDDGNLLSPFISPFGSRSASPNRPSAKRADSSPSLSGLLEGPWSALQNFTNNILEGGPRSRTPNAHRSVSTNGPFSQWGPPSPQGPRIGGGTEEERQSQIRALKRRDLLSANGHMYPDTTGKLKRRNSDERMSSSAPPTEHDDRDALVYIHAVKPQDTLAGISIKFNCDLTVLKKANRLWANDSIQFRTTLMIPVDACGVKGTPIADKDKDLTELLSPSTPQSAIPDAWKSSILSDDTSAQSDTQQDSNSPWKHDSWVMLSGNPEPTEIGRLPRRTLGFFPPARRKSTTFSDRTPSTSFELSRSSTLTSPTNSPNHPNHAAHPSFSSTSSLSNTRRSRGASITQGFVLHGPGGVGTLNRNVRAPGPANDGLNKLFASHLPDVKPPPGQDVFTLWNPGLLDMDAGLNGAEISSRALTGGGVRPSSPGVDFDFNKVGGAIETWARKVATRASTMLAESGSGSGSTSTGATGGPRGGAFPAATAMGDLIEMRDAADIDESQALTEDHRGRGQANAYGGSARPDLPSGMRGRGPASSVGKRSKGD